MPFGRKSPLEALALPGVILAYKYSQFRQRRREAASRRVTERELAALHHKIDKLLSKLEESEPDPPTSQEDECVICINARATMQTSPCGHRVVCRRCFVKTIQSAVAQRLLPLRCVICRARVNRLTSSSGTWRIQESASSYSMGAKSWASAGVGAGGVHASASSYSMGDAHSGHHAFHPHPALHGRYPRSPNGGGRVAQSDSLYSMSSTGSSSLSGVSHMSAYSKTSSISSGLCSPASPISPSAMSAYTQTPVMNNHLAPPGASTSHGTLTLSPSGSSVSGSLSPRDDHHHSHSHSGGCPAGCSGAIPRKPLNSLSNSSSSGSSISSCSSFPPATHTYPGRRYTKGRLTDLQNRLPPIKEFRSPAKVPHPSPVHISNPRFRYSSYTKSSSSAHEIAPLLCEPPSPPKRPMNILAASASTNGLCPPPLKAGGTAKISPLVSKNSLPKNAYTLGNKDKKTPLNSTSGNTAKVNGKLSSTTTNNSNSKKVTYDANGNSVSLASTPIPKSSASNQNSNNKSYSAPTSRSNSSNRSFPLFSNTNSNHKEKADNKKNESMERKKKEEKLKMKAEKEARKVGVRERDATATPRTNGVCKDEHSKNTKQNIIKNVGGDDDDDDYEDDDKDEDDAHNVDGGRNGGGVGVGGGLLCLYGGLAAWKVMSEEKRLAKEEERLAKLIAKEEKKKGKKEAKELLIANDGNCKK
ncbi:homeobox protein 2 isoform X1 [Bactrocera dorsalis]|uniref:Homeobox protein 2 isoform X1 n=1 Tax=Bactrocera dorsalis TaxID=27457 RepID=A0ABM3JF62_BACDO|nr:homeobox protein 2 isoform X1 [Bactrocera dorsalis]